MYASVMIAVATMTETHCQHLVFRLHLIPWLLADSPILHTVHNNDVVVDGVVCLSSEMAHIPVDADRTVGTLKEVHAVPVA